MFQVQTGRSSTTGGGTRNLVLLARYMQKPSMVLSSKCFGVVVLLHCQSNEDAVQCAATNVSYTMDTALPHRNRHEQWCENNRTA